MRWALGIAVALVLAGLWLFPWRDERAAATAAGAGGAAAEPRAASDLAVSAPAVDAAQRRVEVPAAAGGEVGRSEADPPEEAQAEPTTCTVHGRVSEASGAAIEGVDALRVRFEDAQGESEIADAGDDGTYSISGLAPGRWLVACDPRGYRPAKQAVELAPGGVRQDIALERAAAVRITVRAPDGRPFNTAAREAGIAAPLLAILQPVATAEPPGAFLQGIEGSRSNPYRVGHRQSTSGRPGTLAEDIGTLILDRDPPVYVSLVLQSAVLATEFVEPGQDEVAFILDPGRLLDARSALRLRTVEAESERPLAGVHVFLREAFMAPRSTDAEGVAVIEDCAPGTYDLWLLPVGREHLRRRVTLPPGATLDLGTLELALETHLSGRVVDGAGEPVETAIELGVVDPATREVTMIVGQIWTSNPMGAFEIEGLGRGEYLVRTSAMRYPRASLHARDPVLVEDEPSAVSPNRLVSTLGGPVDDLELVVVPLGRLLLRGERADWKTLRFQALDGQGLERAAGRLHDTLQHSVDLPRGGYRVRVTGADGALVLEQAVTVGEKAVVVQLPPG